jgi:SAM-dependent methyltransferase
MSPIRQWMRKQNFDPGPFGFIVNPFAICRKNIIRHLREFAPKISGDILDVGCGSSPYRSVFSHTRYHGVDLDRSVCSQDPCIQSFDGKKLPYSDNHFDAIICTQVFEHVFTPDEFLQEIYRVLKPDGKLLLTVPFIWDEHEIPYDFGRYTSFGIKHLLEKNNFIVTEFRKSTVGSQAVTQLIIAMIVSKLWKFGVIGRWLTRFLSSVTILIISPLLFLFSSQLVYLDNIVFAKK